MRTPLQFDQILHNEPIYHIQQKWQRPLNDHERNLVAMVYDWCRTNLEVEEIHFIDDLRKQVIKGEP